MNMSTLIIPIVGMAIPIILVPVILGLKHARLERELEHAERMKALELGRTLPKDVSLSAPSPIGMAFGVGVPVGVFFCAWMASTHENASPVAIWASAGVVGLAGVVCGAILAYRQLDTSSAGPRVENGLAGTGKPEIDADHYDAFDVVGSRG
jgi:hypothetical protein